LVEPSISVSRNVRMPCGSSTGGSDTDSLTAHPCEPSALRARSDQVPVAVPQPRQHGRRPSAGRLPVEGWTAGPG
jgi:hypothetical protein